MLHKDQNIIQIALPIPFADSLTYLVPQYISFNDIVIGARVIVPFRNKEMVAIVISKDQNGYAKNLKEIVSILDYEDFLPEQTLKIYATGS